MGTAYHGNGLPWERLTMGTAYHGTAYHGTAYHENGIPCTTSQKPTSTENRVMVNILNSNSSRSNLSDFALFGVFQTLAGRYSGNASIIERSGATVFSYRGASSIERLSIRNYNSTLRRQTTASRLGSAFSSASPSIVPTTTNQLIQNLQEQINSLRTQINGNSSSSSTTPSSIDGLFRQRGQSQNQSYAITATKSVAQETPQNGTPTYGNELVFSVSRAGNTAVASSVSYRFVEHLSTVTSSDFTLYGDINRNRFKVAPLKDPATERRPSGTVSFNAGETQKNVTISIRDDQELEGSDETLAIGLYNTLTGSYIASASGLVAADHNTDINSVSTQLTYTNPLGQEKTYNDTSGFLRLDSLERADWRAFLTGQLGTNERLRVNISYEYGLADEDDLTMFDATITTMTIMQDFFLTEDPNFVATLLDMGSPAMPGDAGNVIEAGVITLNTASLQTAFTALTGNQDLKIDFMINEAFYVDSTGMDTTTPVSSSFVSLTDSVSVVASNNTKYSLDTPVSTTTQEGDNYEVVVRRDNAYHAADVTIMLDDVGGSGFGTPTDDVTGGLDHTVMFAVGELTATLTLPITDDVDPEGIETFSVLLDSVTISSYAPLSLMPTPPGTAYIDTTMNTFDAMIDASDTATADVYTLTPPIALSYDEDAPPTTFDFTIMRADITLNGAVDFELVAGARAGFDINDIASIDIDGTVVTTSLSQNVMFAVGIDTAVVMITLTDDTLAENIEDFDVNLIASATAMLGTTSSFSANIQASDVTASMYSISSTTPAPGASVDEGNTIEVVVSRTFALEEADATITITPGAIDPTDATDFVGGNTHTLMFGATDTTATLTITVADDPTTEGAENFSVAISAVANTSIAMMITDTFSTASSDLMISPSDIMNTFTLSPPAPLSAAEGGALNFSIMRTDTTVDGETIFFDISDISTGATAFDTNDYTVTGATLSAGGQYQVTFAGTSSTANVQINVVNDNREEADENFRVELMDPTGTAVLVTPTFDGTVTANDPGNTVFSLASSSPSSTSEGGTYEFTITRDTITGMPTTTVDFSLDDVGLSGFDMDDIMFLTPTGGVFTPNATGLGGNISFAVGSNVATITVQALNDSVIGENAIENFSITASSTGAMTFFAPDMLTGLSIADVPDTIFNLSTSSATVNEHTGNYELIVSRSQIDPTKNTITLMLSEIAGLSFADDISGLNVSGGDLSFGAFANVSSVMASDIPTTTDITVMFGATDSNVTLTFGINDDNILDAGESFSATLSTAVTGTSLGANTTATININDNESEFAFEFRNTGGIAGTAITDLTEGNTYDLVIMRTGTGGSYQLNLDLIDLGGGFNLSDYIVGTPLINFSPGADTFTATVRFSDADGPEGNETFRISASFIMAEGTPILSTTPTIYTLMDSGGGPAPVSFSVSSTSPTAPTATAESGSYIFTVMRSTNVGTASVGFDLAAVGGSLFDAADITSFTTASVLSSLTGTGLSGMVDFANGDDTVDVTVNFDDDTTVEGTENYEIMLSAGSAIGGSIGTMDSITGLSITDNDSAFTVSVTGASGAVIPTVGIMEGTDFEVVVDRTGGTTTGTVGITFDDPTGAFVAADYTPTTSLSLTFAAGVTSQTLTFTLDTDGIIEAAESFVVMLTPTPTPTGTGTWTATPSGTITVAMSM